MASEDWKLWLFGNKNPTICFYFESFIYWLLIFSVIVHFALNLNRPFVPLPWSLGWETLIKNIIFEQNSERETRSVKLLCSRPRPECTSQERRQGFRPYVSSKSNNSKQQQQSLYMYPSISSKFNLGAFCIILLGGSKGARNCHVSMTCSNH